MVAVAAATTIEVAPSEFTIVHTVPALAEVGVGMATVGVVAFVQTRTVPLGLAANVNAGPAAALDAIVRRTLALMLPISP
jgi:hypothetical protein